MKLILKCDSLGPCQKQHQHDTQYGEYTLQNDICPFCGVDVSKFVEDEPTNVDSSVVLH